LAPFPAALTVVPLLVAAVGCWSDCGCSVLLLSIVVALLLLSAVAAVVACVFAVVVLQWLWLQSQRSSSTAGVNCWSNTVSISFATTVSIVATTHCYQLLRKSPFISILLEKFSVEHCWKILPLVPVSC
jgi:hypothetical protein